MTVYMPPIDRKKKVPDRYNPDTFRVISSNAEETHQKFEPQPYKRSFQPDTPQERLFPDIACGRTRVLPHPTPDYRSSNPHPKQIGFIRTDVRLLNEPVCAVYSKATRSAQHNWWPARANEGTLQKPDFKQDTIYRNDFMYTKELAPQANYRHSANPNTTPSRGIVPVNFLREKDGSQRFYKEGVSFEHQYNSRVDPNYPIRGKRHGALVWDRMSKEDTQRFIDYHSRLDREEMTASDPSPKPQQSQPVSALPQHNTNLNHKPPSPTSTGAGQAEASLAAAAPSPQQPNSPPVAKEE